LSHVAWVTCNYCSFWR